MNEITRICGAALLLALALGWVSSCVETPEVQEPLSEITVTDGGKVGADAAGEKTPEVTPEPVKPLPKVWETSQPVLDISPKSRYRFVRSIIHLHSVYSHDACDGNPHVDGKKNIPCLKRLREALCQDAIDVAFLTEHKTKMAEGDALKEMILYQDGDERLMEGSAIIGNRFVCKGGHEVTVFPGAENALMPVGLKQHPKLLTGKDLNGTYGDDSKEAIANFKAAGAAVLIAHTEDKALDYLLARDLHGIEIFNLHAAMDPRKRGPDLKLVGEIAVGTLFSYLRNPTDYPHPDLSFLGFHERIPVYMDKWDKLLAKKMVYGFGGTDSHENVIRTPMSDGQRPDSYARMMRWFSNHLMVKERSVKAYREALLGGRSLLVFEILGTPRAFSFYAETSDGKRVEMGATTTPGQTIKAIKVVAEHPYLRSLAPVHSKIKLYQITDKGSQVVAEGNDVLELRAPPVGTYRVEVSITPLHLKGLMTEETKSYLKSYPWIQSNPIRISP